MTIPDIMFNSYSWTEINIFMFVKRNTAKDGTLQVSLQQIAEEFGTTKGKVRYLLQKFNTQKLMFCTAFARCSHDLSTASHDVRTISHDVRTTSAQTDIVDSGKTDDFRTAFARCSHDLSTASHDVRTISHDVRTTSAQNDTNECKIKLRANAFGQKLVPYMEMYGKPMIREFFDYWTETNENGTKMRFEKEKTFDVKLRLARWKKNDTEKKNHATPNSDIGIILKDSQEKDYTEGLW